MANGKRVTIATLSGLLFGFVCFALASSSPHGLPTAAAIQIIASRTLIGFAIGISVLKLGHWSLHGLVIGLIMSIPLAVGAMLAPEHPEFGRTAMFISSIVMGMIYGVLIELITTKLFKAGRFFPRVAPAM
jgi:hypothetical protein